ncbi:MAG: peptidase M2 family protein [Proteobacteria bacterium]|nr:peptidase M2 family protein [Pseudomonadota bacterium]
MCHYFRGMLKHFFLVLCCVPLSALAGNTGQFLKKVEADLLRETEHEQRTEWVQQNFITEDTTRLTADANATLNELSTRYAKESKSHKGANADEKRKLYLLLNGLTIPSPKDPKKNAEMTRLISELESAYGSGKYCDATGRCRDLQELEEVIKSSRDPKELLDAWNGWHSIAKPMKAKYERIVELGNQGARELGFHDLSDVWMAKYDMSSAQYGKMIDRLWGEVKPLYEQLHCYIRSQLNKKYGDSIVAKEGPIPAHLLGNMWAQQWPNIHDLTDIESADSVDITKLLVAAKYDARKMVETGEGFYTSLGLPKLPKTFYERSLFEKPRDREVVCHASAWDIDSKDDVRIKMCIKPDEDSFRTIHHELGHIYYYLMYKDLPPLYQSGANDGFHEGLGDAIQLSLTNDYLKKINLLSSGKKSSTGPDIDYLFRMALEKVAFLPFGLLVDKWRWQVFSGQTKPGDYNRAWWELREKYQGVKAPNPRDADAFDPGAKYHVASGTPYSRYFLAHILQFQFHRALCKAAGFSGPLSECSIYGSKEAGARLAAMMKLGASRSWQEALKALTGSGEMDAGAIRDYFAPLEEWLKKKNAGQKCGWN